MLAVGLAAQEHLAVQAAGAIGEAPLRGGGVQFLPTVELVEGGGEPVDSVALRHVAAPAQAPAGVMVGAPEGPPAGATPSWMRIS